MLYFPFKNYEEFKELFGIEKRSNGVSVRKNKILLGHLKSKELLHVSVMFNTYEFLHVTNLTDLQNKVFRAVERAGLEDEKLTYKIKLMDFEFYSAKYATDRTRGVCEDGDINSIRYVNIERNRVFKMKTAKFLREIMLETFAGKMFSPSVINWICGDVFTQMWSTHVSKYASDLTLNVDEKFYKIYDQDYLEGDFHSCMVNEGYESFYANSVSAKAAYLTNNEGNIVARAVIFTDVKDQDGKTWRLCERQYSSGGDDRLKRVLVDKLIQGKHIDGYKTIGASCHDTRAFVSVDGESLNDKRFRIDCRLDVDDDVSYQDSFKWFNFDSQTAYNRDIDQNTIMLDITDGRINGVEWDDWNECYCNETCECFYNGISYNVDVNCMGCFFYVRSLDEYHHQDDVFCCSYCGDYELIDRAVNSTVTDESYCCDDCLEADEVCYKKETWYYSEFDHKYYEFESDLDEINVWNESQQSYKTMTISKDTLDGIDTITYNEEYYNEWDCETGLPYGVEE